MLDEKTYNELKEYTVKQDHKNDWLREIGYIEGADMYYHYYIISTAGKIALREYELYAERNRFEDDRYAKDTNRQIKISKASIILAALATVFGAIAAATGVIQLIISFR